MLGEATLHVSRTFAGERNTASHSVCRPAKALPWGLWHPILMQFYSGPLMHLLSGVDRCLAIWTRSFRKTKIVPPGACPVSRIESLASDNNPTITGGDNVIS